MKIIQQGYFSSCKKRYTRTHTRLKDTFANMVHDFFPWHRSWGRRIPLADTQLHSLVWLANWCTEMWGQQGSNLWACQAWRVASLGWGHGVGEFHWACHPFQQTHTFPFVLCAANYVTSFRRCFQQNIFCSWNTSGKPNRIWETSGHLDWVQVTEITDHQHWAENDPLVHWTRSTG